MEEKDGRRGKKGEGRGGRQAGRRQEDRRKEENVGGMAESQREKKSVSLLPQGKGKEEYGKGGFGGRTGERASERASDRASERARSARCCTVKGVS